MVCKWLLGSPGAMIGSMRAAAVRLVHGRRQKLEAEMAVARQAMIMAACLILTVAVAIGVSHCRGLLCSVYQKSTSG